MSRNDSWRRDGRDRSTDRYRPPSPRRGASPPAASYDSWRPADDRRDRGDRRSTRDSHRGSTRDSQRASDRDSQRASGRDSQRASGHDSHGGAANDSRRTSGQASDAKRAPPGDVHRPKLPQSDFTFRVDQPLHVAPFSFPPATNPPAGRRGERRGGLPRKPGRPRWQPPPHPSERALISGDTFRIPGQRIFDTSASAKFRDVDEMSDDQEVAMEMSSQSSHEGAEKPVSKRPRTDAKAADADAVPKWSNPDPYTALPCPDEATRKKRDMVQLIRKARVEALKPNTDAPPEAANFISFDSSDEDDAPPPPPPPPTSLPPRPPPPPRDGPVVGKSKSSSTATDAKLTPDTSGPLGSRKRTVDDEIKPPDYGQLKKAGTRRSKGTLLPEWQPKDDQDSCPWKAVGSSEADNATIRCVVPCCISPHL